MASFHAYMGRDVTRLEAVKENPRMIEHRDVVVKERPTSPAPPVCKAEGQDIVR